MNKKALLFNRFRLLGMDVEFFTDVAKQIQKLKEDHERGIPRSNKAEVLVSCSRIGMDKQFVGLLFDQFGVVSPDQRFLTTLSQYSAVRNKFVLEKIVPLKKEGDLKVKDGGWETERIQKIKSVCEGSGIPNQLIGDILLWLHAQSRDTITKALGR